jgi:hypothetical protein
VGDEAIQQVSLPLSSDTVVSSAAKGLATWSGGAGSHADDHLLQSKLGEDSAQRIVTIPLVVRGRAVAVLYADSAGLDSESINLEALETLVTVSGMAVELLSAARGTGAAPKRVEEAAAPAPEPEPAYEPASEYTEPAPVEPAFSGADTIQSYESAPVAEPEAIVEAVPVDEPSGEFEVTPVEEAAVTEDTWSTSSEPEPAASTPRRRYGQDADLPVEVHGDEERRLHNDARRFARLLISEIKLYNEQKVAEGRTEHDLYDRLREYIDRSREMYDKRVKAEVAARYDYFHGELVNTLAEGDASKLGSNYPGATVNA